MQRRFWSAAEVQMMRELFADVPTADLAALFARTERATSAMAHKLGLSKSAAYLASPEARRLGPRNHTPASIACRFKPGTVPWNKGKTVEIRGRMAETFFKPGKKPPNAKPVGSTRVIDGYLQIKMTDTGYPPHDWVGKHVLVWQEHHGKKVPAGHVITFADRNNRNFDPANLHCISRKELAQRNHWKHSPIGKLAQLKGAITRQVNRIAREAKEAKQ